MRRNAVLSLVWIVALGFGSGDLVRAAQSELAREGLLDAGVSTGATALLIDEQLNTRAVRVLQLSDNAIVIVDDGGRRVRLSVEGIIALLPAGSLPNPADGVGAVSPAAAAKEIPAEELRARLEATSGGMLETVDGMRFPGQPGPTSGPVDGIEWAHPRFGTVTFDIERLASFVKPEAPGLRLALEDDPAEDVLHLSNGDRLRGFIVSLGDPVEIESEGQTTEIPAERVSSAVLSNPREGLDGLIVWLDDGTVAGAERVRSDSGRDIQITLPTGQDAIYEIEHLRAIGFESGRLLSLSDIEPVVQEPEGDRLLAPRIRTVQHPDDLLTGSAATLDAFDVEIPGPMRVEWEIPREAIRFATTASLGDDAAPWGDCEVVVEVDGVELYRRRVHPDNPVAAVNVPLDGGRRLAVIVEPGRFGPIKDRVVLHRPLLLLAPRVR